MPTIENPGYIDLDKIDSGDYFFGREHAQEFHSRYIKNPYVTVRQALLAFAALVMPPNVKAEDKEFKAELFEPAKFGLVVAARDVVGFPPLLEEYSKWIGKGDAIDRAHRVIQVGSFITFMSLYQRDRIRIPGFSEHQEYFDRRMASHIKKRIEKQADKD